jgi:hypothetical protein
LFQFVIANQLVKEGFFNHDNSNFGSVHLDHVRSNGLVLIEFDNEGLADYSSHLDNIIHELKNTFKTTNKENSVYEIHF